MENYAKLTDEAKEALGRIDTHTYGGTKRKQLKETAVNAGIISAPALMIIALSGICLYTVPELEQTFSLIQDGNGLVFHGTADSWVDTEAVTAGCLEKHLTLKTVLGSNHSLESDDVFANLQDLLVIMEDVNRFLLNQEV